MNPEHKICTLGPDSEFELEATVNLGKGYVLKSSRSQLVCRADYVFLYPVV